MEFVVFFFNCCFFDKCTNHAFSCRGAKENSMKQFHDAGLGIYTFVLLMPLCTQDDLTHQFV